MSYANLVLEKGLRSYDDMKGFIKIGVDGEITRLPELPAGVSPTIDFEMIYSQAESQFVAGIKNIAATITPTFSSVLLKVYPHEPCMDLVFISEDEIAGKPNYFENFEYMASSTFARIELSEEVLYLYHLMADMDLKESYYSLHGLPTADIIAPENVAFAGVLQVAIKLFENHKELIQSLLPVTEDFFPLIYASGSSNNMNSSFFPKLFMSDELYAKYYPEFAKQRSYFPVAIEFINNLPLENKIRMYLELMIVMEIADESLLEGTEMTFEHDRDFDQIPDGKPIELLRVANPYEYLQEFTKQDLASDTKRLIDGGLTGWHMTDSIVYRILAGLQLEGYPDPFEFMDGLVESVDGTNIVIEGVSLKNPNGLSIEDGLMYDLVYNALTNEILHATEV